MAPPTANTCVRERGKKRKRRERAAQCLQVVPYGFGRIALYKASWKEKEENKGECSQDGKRQTGMDTMDNETAR